MVSSEAEDEEQNFSLMPPSFVRKVDCEGSDTEVVLCTSSKPPGQERERNRAFLTPNVVLRCVGGGTKCW